MKISKKRAARILREHTGEPARKICRTKKKSVIVTELERYGVSVEIK